SRSRAWWSRSWRIPPPATCACRSCSRDSDLAAPPRRDQELAVAVGAGDRAVGETEHGPAGLAAEPVGDARADCPMEFGVADDAPLADLRRADLELRLDQRDQMGGGRGQGERRRQDHFQADEAGIADDAIQVVRYLRAREVARIRPLEDDDAGILAQVPGQLP